MTTFLAQQLKKLAVPQTTLLLLDKTKPSLLFDPKEAASLDRDTVFAIGLTGLEELEQLNECFAEFQNTLFSEWSKTFERSIQDKETNAKLDATIQHFLTCLTPYVLLRPAHKALEWLIHRFHINMFNIDDLVCCIMPYHETRIFVRVLQLLDLSNPSGNWHWLEPLQKPGVPLPKSALYTHCFSDLSFMKFICEMVPKTLKVFTSLTKFDKTAISFYTITIIGSFEQSKKLTEEMISVVLPYVLKGFKSNLINYCTSSYMILCQIVRKATLSYELLDKLCIKILKNLKPELLKEAAVCLVVIFQYQKFKKISDKLLTHLHQSKRLFGQLETLAENYQLEPFLNPLLKKLVPKVLGTVVLKQSPSEKKLLIKIIKTVKFEEATVCRVVKLLLTRYCNMAGKKNVELKQLTSDLLNQLESRYPTDVDKAVDSVLLTADDFTKRKIQKLLFTVSSSKTSLLGRNNDLIFLNICHPNVSRRVMGIKALIQLKRSGKIMKCDFIKECILPRLNDDSPDVVSVCLTLKEGLFELAPVDEIFYILCELLMSERTTANKWTQVKQTVLELLCNVELQNGKLELHLLFILLSFFIVESHLDLKIVLSTILKSKFATTNTYLLEFVKDVDLDSFNTLDHTEETIVKWNKQSFQVLNDAAKTINREYQCEMLSIILESGHKKQNVVASFIGLNILCNLIESAETVDEKIDFAQKCLKHCKKVFSQAKIDHNFNEAVEVLLTGNIPFMVIFVSLQCIMHIKLPNSSAAQDLQVDLFHFLSSNSVDCKNAFQENFSTLLEEFLQKENLKNINQKLTYLSKLWFADNPKLQRLSFFVSESVISKTKDMRWIAKEDNFIVFMLMASLVNGDADIRRLCLNCMSAICQKLPGDSVNSFKKIFEYIISFQEEILADNSQYPQLLSHWLKPVLVETATNNTGMPTRRRTGNLRNLDEHFVLTEMLRLCNSPKVPDIAKLGALHAMRECNSYGILSELSKLLVTILYESEPIGKILALPAAILREILSKYSAVTAPMMTSVDVPEFQALEQALKSKLWEFDGESVQHMATKTIRSKFCNGIPSDDIKQQLLSFLVSTYVDSDSSTKESLMWKALRKICTHAKLISKELRINDSTSEVQTIKEARLTRGISSSNKDNDGESSGTLTKFLGHGNWKKVMAMLEIVQMKAEIEDVQLLISPLFDLLKKSLEFESNPQLEYLRQLILSCLHNCCQMIKSRKIELAEELFQVELAVQCIRFSPNPQTHHHALLVLNLAATMYPEHVLHNIMGIFTFMGASLVRQDDSYSFQMIIKTVDTIIPAMMQASQCQQDSATKTPIIVAAVTQVFVDALKDIPPHRQLPLFSKLISMLGTVKYLWFPLIQIFSNVVTTTDAEAKERGSLPKAVEFAIDLCHSMNPAIQISACLKIIQYLGSLPNNKDDDSLKSGDMEFMHYSSALFDTKSRSEKELRHFKYTAISFVAALLSSEEFVSQVVDLNQEQVSKLQVLYRLLLEATMQYLQQVALQVQENSSKPTFKFWKALQHKLYDVLEKVNSLLPNDQFISVVQGLLNHPTPSVCRKAMDMLNSKLSHQNQDLTHDDIMLLLGLVSSLRKAAKGKKRLPSSSESEELVVNQQTALMSLKLICRLTGSSYPAHFRKVLTTVIKLLKRSTNSIPLLSCTLLCLAELCQNLKAHCLPHLNKFMPLIILLLEDVEKLESNEFLLMSIVTTVQRLVENLSGFLSTYLQTIVTQICKLSSLHPDDESISKSTLQFRLRTVKSQLANKVPERVLIPVVTKCYDNLSTDSCFQNALGPLMSILKESILVMDKRTLNAFLADLQNFFLVALDFRQSHNKIAMNRIDFVEENAIDAMITFVLKLSETTFRPIFYRVFEWATLQEDECKERILTFYRLSSSLAEKLKSLFVLFASHFVKNAADILEANNEEKGGSYFGTGRKSKEKACQLLKYVLRTLHICFLHDNKCLVDQQCFETLMQPLVDQIENQIGSEEQYQERIKNYVSPCLAQFAVASADDTSWKPFNYQILLKTRHSSPNVRFAALEVLQDLVQKLGDDYMVLLPESIPFLAELMEDESFEVEQQCQAVVAKMEQILGEPLMKYF